MVFLLRMILGGASGYGFVLSLRDTAWDWLSGRLEAAGLHAGAVNPLLLLKVVTAALVAILVMELLRIAVVVWRLGSPSRT